MLPFHLPRRPGAAAFTLPVQSDWPDRRGAAVNGIAALVLLGLLARSWHTLKRIHQERHHARLGALPRRLQTWEGEGGRPDPDPPTTAASVAGEEDPGAAQDGGEPPAAE